MPLNESQIAFKNLFGISQTSNNLGINNENYGLFFNVPSTNVWSSTIPYNDPDESVNKNVSVKIVAELVKIEESLTLGKYAAYQAVWVDLPAGKDPRTNLDYEFGKGSLANAEKWVSGIPTEKNVIFDIVPPSYGWKFKVKPYSGAVSAANQIGDGDPREWIYQYSSGVFFQNNLQYAEPKKLEGYFYIGNKLSSLDSAGAEVIRVSATGPDVTQAFYATVSTPFITTYSVNHLYLIDFANGNTSSVKLNIDFIGTSSVYKYGLTGLNELSSGDIKGATGSTAGPTYYLTWNTDGYFLFFESNPSQGLGTYKNESLTINKVGGINIGSTFNEVKIQDMFTNFLYPESLPNFNTLSLSHPRIVASSQSQYNFIDVGRGMTGTVTFSWTGQNSSDLLSLDTLVSDITSVPTSTTNWPAPRVSTNIFNFSTGIGTFSFTQSVFSNVPDRRIFSISATRRNNTGIRIFGEIEWAWRAYFGSSTFSSLSSTTVNSMTNSLMTQSIGTWTIAGTNGYKYFAFPDDTKYSFKNITYYNLPILLATQGYASVDNNNNYTTMTLTNSSNQSTTYRLYRTLNEINGPLIINLTK